MKAWEAYRLGKEVMSFGGKKIWFNKTEILCGYKSISKKTVTESHFNPFFKTVFESLSLMCFLMYFQYFAASSIPYKVYKTVYLNRSLEQKKKKSTVTGFAWTFKCAGKLNEQ